MGDDQGLMDRCISKYIEIREARGAATTAAKEIDDGFKAKLETLERFMLGLLNKNSPDLTKASSVHTAHGICYRELDIKPSAADWDKVYEWIVENNAFELLEKRLTKTFVTKYVAAHDGDPPPGVNILREYKAKVRKD